MNRANILTYSRKSRVIKRRGNFFDFEDRNVAIISYLIGLNPLYDWLFVDWQVDLIQSDLNFL